MTKPAKKLIEKTARLDLRTTEEQRKIIDQAAALRQITRTEFILQTVYQEALKIVEEATKVELGDEAWLQFCNALDSPPKDLPGLKELLSERSVFE